ncbi:uncharacterized protein LOC111716874 isoform X2 [Eurytemora carolleeae]|uniref:uncharacterized protein LOC111716874 isoform X2 n=1 Tax=Eurytemora carolleeae TaxID=1294199 RepID=UPI000C767443|nr:uncharacterized protein LOC111716874 isoform X2 [Eurytemora carolleeae]|eukprot:XP_023348150.1 uncharacterized protein LOC111716874 isoform X2 [Eurytemora affinis]
MLSKLVGLGLLALVATQDTHYCPDGFEVSEVEGNVECILLGGLQERVTKHDAEILCGAHDGNLVTMDEGHGGQKNEKIKKMIADKAGQGSIGIPGLQYDEQWWIGATVRGHHNENNWGNWVWDEHNTSVTWFDWMKDEPNDWQGQNCLTFVKDQDIFGFGFYGWNDWGCENVARYICERPTLNLNKTDF